MPHLTLQEKAELEQSWAQQVDTAQKEAQRVKEATESKVASVIDRLHQLTEREAKREQQRGRTSTCLAAPP